jgi:UDP-N-acetylmuramoylalanine--D-glutamate ligase
MFPITTFSGKTVAVFGLARSGLAAVHALQAGGATVLGWDDGEIGRAAARAGGITPVDLSTADWNVIDALVMSPGVAIYGPNIHWSVVKAEAHGVPVIGDIELFARQIDTLPEPIRPRVVAITGTNGKSTTTALIAHILTCNGLDVSMGGNIGTGVLALASPRAGAVYVLELSSYQLDLVTSLRADVAIHLNLSADHLERHGTIERYAAAKARIFAHQTQVDTAVIGVDDPWGEGLCTRLMAKGRQTVVPISATQSLPRGISALGNVLWDMRATRPLRAADLSLAPTLPGRHNRQNAAAAYAACRALGLPMAGIEKAIHSFPGLRHRLQLVARIGHSAFYNDSKATNADATAQALASFPRLRWIVGGQAKTGGIESLSPLFGRIEHAYLIGEAAGAFAATLEGQAPSTICGTMAQAVAAAGADAAARDDGLPVVFSPACASFDQYSDFEARGDDFIAQVQGLVNHQHALSAGAGATTGAQ